MSDAQTRASRKWNENNLDRIYLTVKQGQKEIIQAAAAAAGESVNSYIAAAINQRMERDAVSSQS